MTLHLLKDISNPLALRLLSSEASSSAATPIVVLLSPGVPAPSLPHCEIFHLQEQASAQEKAAISYSRLVKMIFQAKKVIAW